MMTAESMLSKRPVLRMIVALFFLTCVFRAGLSGGATSSYY